MQRKCGGLACFVHGRWWVVVHSEFSVLLWSKALVLDLDQAEQKVQVSVCDSVFLCVQEITFKETNKTKWKVLSLRRLLT